MSPGFLRGKVYAEFSNWFPDPSRTHLERKIMETNCLKSNFRNVIRNDLGQLWLFMCDSEASSELELLANAVKPYFSKELFVHILCFLNKVPELSREEERMGLAFVISGTFCAFTKWFLFYWLHRFWAPAPYILQTNKSRDRNLSSIKKTEDLGKHLQLGGKSYWLRFFHPQEK